MRACMCVYSKNMARLLPVWYLHLSAVNVNRSSGVKCVCMCIHNTIIYVLSLAFLSSDALIVPSLIVESDSNSAVKYRVQKITIT